MFKDRLEFSAQIVEKTLLNYLQTFDKIEIVDAMLYSLTGGKKLRAFFVMESAALLKLIQI